MFSIGPTSSNRSLGPARSTATRSSTRRGPHRRTCCGTGHANSTLGVRGDAAAAVVRRLLGSRCTSRLVPSPPPPSLRLWDEWEPKRRTLLRNAQHLAQDQAVEQGCHEKVNHRPTMTIMWEDQAHKPSLLRTERSLLPTQLPRSTTLVSTSESQVV